MSHKTQIVFLGTEQRSFPFSVGFEQNSSILRMAQFLFDIFRKSLTQWEARVATRLEDIEIDISEISNILKRN